MPDVANLQVVVQANTSHAEAGLSSLGAKVAGVGSSITGALGGVAIAAIAGVGAAFAGSVAAAAGFEQQMSAISAVSGATAAELQQLSTLALELGKNTSFSATEAAQGIEELVKAGVSISDIMGGAASASLSLAAAGAISVGEAAEIAANAMNAFSLQGSDLGHVADVIAGAANASAISVNDFKFSLASSGAVAATVGMSFDDLATAIALMGNAGIKGSDAGTSLKTMLLNLQPGTEKQTALFKQLGIITADGANKFFDATGKIKSLAEISQVLQDALKGMTDQQKLATLEMLFGSDAIRAAAVVAKAGAEGVNELAAAIGKVTAQDVARERLNNLKGSFEQLMGSVETLAITIGSAFLPGIKRAVDGLTAFTNTLIPLAEQWAPVIAQKMGEIGTAIGATLGPAFERAKTIVTDAWRTIGQVFQNDWSPSTTIDPVVNAIGIGAIKIRDAIQQISDAWGTVQQVFQNNWSPSTTIDPFVNSVGLAAIAVRDLVKALQDGASIAGNSGAWDSVANGFKNLGDAMTIARDRGGELGTALSGLVGPLNTAATPAQIIGAALRGAALGFEYATLQVKSFVDGLLTSLQVATLFGTGISSIQQAIQALGRGDLPAAAAAVRAAAQAFGEGMAAADAFRTRGLDRAAEGARIMAQAIDTNLAASAATIQTHMDAANQAVEVGSAGWASMIEANGGAVTASATATFQSVATETATGMAASTAAIAAESGPSAAAMDATGQQLVASVLATNPQIATAAATGAQGVTTAVTTEAPASAAAATSLGDGMVKGLEPAVPRFAQAGKDAAAGATNAVSGATGTASAAGKALGDALGSGLEGGILAYVGRVAAAAAALVRAAVGAANAEAGNPKSPAPVTEELGYNMGWGLASGWEASAALVNEAAQATIVGAIQAATTAITELSAQITELIAALSTNVSAQTAAMATNVKTQTTEMASSVMNATSEMASTVTGTFDRLSDKVSEASADLAQAVTGQWDSMARVVGERAEYLTSTVTTTFQTMQRNTEKATSELADVVGRNFEQIDEAIFTVPPAVGKAQSAIGSLKAPNAQPFVDAFEEMAEAADEAASAFKKAAKELGKWESESKNTEHGRNSFGSGMGRSLALAGAMAGGSFDTLAVDLKIDGRTSERIYLTGRDLAVQRGRA